MMYDVLAAATSAKFLWSNYVGSRLDLQLSRRKRKKKKRINDRISVEIPQDIFSWCHVSHRLPADVQKNMTNYPST
jgi:formylmethanofuran dehydrogenase subunit E